MANPERSKWAFETADMPVEAKLEAALLVLDTLLSDGVAVRAESARLRTALQLVEYGSCDGCGNRNKCVECGARFHNWTEDSGNVPELHVPDCAIGLALGRTK